MFRTRALHQVSLQEKVLAPAAVETGVLLLEDVFAAEPAPEGCHSVAVPRLSGPNERIRRNSEGLGKLVEPLRVASNERLNRDALRPRRQHIFEGVFVCAGLQNCCVAGQALIPRDGVSLHELKRVADVRRGINIRN